MTVSDLPAYLKAGREFMHQVRDPEFRSYLKHIVGWDVGCDVVIAFDDEALVSLVSRLAFNEATSPCLIAIPHPEERFGFRLMSMRAVPRRPWWKWRRQHHAEPVSPQSSVGMLYSSLTQCDAYVPSEWVGSASMTFSKAPEQV